MPHPEIAHALELESLYPPPPPPPSGENWTDAHIRPNLNGGRTVVTLAKKEGKKKRNFYRTTCDFDWQPCRVWIKLEEAVVNTLTAFLWCVDPNSAFLQVLCGL